MQKLKVLISLAEKAGACSEAIDDIKACGSYEEILAHNDAVSWVCWASDHHIIPSHFLAWYYKAEQAAKAEYYKIEQAAKAEYYKVKQAAWAEYYKIDQAAWAKMLADIISWLDAS